VSILELSPREASLEAGGYVKGCAIAIVTQNRDTEGWRRGSMRGPGSVTPVLPHGNRRDRPS
jgi:hypothetical protein